MDRESTLSALLKVGKLGAGVRGALLGLCRQALDFIFIRSLRAKMCLKYRHAWRRCCVMLQVLRAYAVKSRICHTSCLRLLCPVTLHKSVK
jgi:hypothetical protein